MHISWRVEADRKGPIFDGRADKVLTDFCGAVAGKMGERGVKEVRSALHSSLRAPTGRYESHINSRHRGNVATINDRGVIYGPWLEGTGSRNQTTRFKGYASFRRAAQQLTREAPRVARELLARFVDRMR